MVWAMREVTWSQIEYASMIKPKHAAISIKCLMSFKLRPFLMLGQQDSWASLHRRITETKDSLTIYLTMELLRKRCSVSTPPIILRPCHREDRPVLKIWLKVQL